MTAASVLLESELPNRAHRGKVRDMYDLGDRLLIVATDRVSAFDVVLPNGIPGKGAVLTQLSAFWFERTASVVPNHFLSMAGSSPDELPYELPPDLIGRSMIVRKAQRLPVECIVRGYMAGSAWAEYQEQGTVCGVRLPPGLRESEPFPQPLFTPTTKAEAGHDENMSPEQFIEALGSMEVANAVRLRSLALYRYGVEYARERGIIIADTKFEFGLLDGEPILIDEMLTPDSSRFWEASEHEPGRHQEAFDKQYVRDWLLQSGWDREPPPPELPPDVVEETSRLYREVYRRLTGAEVRA